VLAEREARVDLELERLQPQLLERRRGGPDRAVAQVAERLAAPERERGREQLVGMARLAGRSTTTR
jgi:hypothetical protein